MDENIEFLEVRECISCKKELHLIEKEIAKKDNKPWQAMWSDGIVDKIAAGYGSVLDGDMFVITICDDCIKETKNKKSLQYVGNYMGLK